MTVWVDGRPVEEEDPCSCECGGRGTYLVELYPATEELTTCYWGRAYWRRCCCPAGVKADPEDMELF